MYFLSTEISSALKGKKKICTPERGDKKKHSTEIRKTLSIKPIKAE